MAKSVQEEKNYEYDKYIFRKIIKRVNTGKKLSKKNGTERQLSLRAAPRERPSRDEIIDRTQKYKHIKLQNITLALVGSTCSKLTHFKFVLALLIYF